LKTNLNSLITPNPRHDISNIFYKKIFCVFEVIIGGTLVVCPASLLNQWENEIKSKLKPGHLKVGQYYGIKRSISATEFAKNDLVTTSYNIVMWDFKKQHNSVSKHFVRFIFEFKLIFVKSS